jgi:acetoin utilization deacetylase AcuC-like enzyme
MSLIVSFGFLFNTDPTPAGKLTEVGKGPGEGTTVNLPLPWGSGEQAMAFVMDEVIAPAAQKFKPDIILISAGFDAHYQEKLAGLQFTTRTYHKLAKDMRKLADELCGGRIVFFLEGGYDLRSLSGSVADSFRGLLGEKTGDKVDPSSMLEFEPIGLVEQAVKELRAIYSDFR